MNETELMDDMYDMMIDRWVEMRRMNPETPNEQNFAKIQQDFNHFIDPRFIFHLTERILREWVDMDENYYPVVATWILGTRFFNTFSSFPYLFINAVKRSGKTRLLKLCAYITNGVYTMSLKEAVLFRLPAIRKCGLFIDETETINGKEKSDLRELLNVAYKKGGTVFRMRKDQKTEKYVADEFELFVPVSTANINGLDDVLADRCLTVMLERSLNKNITNRVEMFDMDEEITLLKYILYENSVTVVTEVCEQMKKTYRGVVEGLWDTIVTKDTTYTTVTTDIPLYNIINNGISGRDLELWLPLFVTYFTFNNNLDAILKIADGYVKERKTTDVMEDRDTSIMITLGKFIHERNENEWFGLEELANSHNMNEGTDPKSKYALHGRGMINILKRLKVIFDRRRIASRREVRLNFPKIKSMIERLGVDLESSPAEPQNAPGLGMFTESDFEPPEAEYEETKT